MLSLALFLITAWVVTAAGRTLLHGLRLPEDATRLERNLIAYGLGLGLLAYGMLTLGLLRLLYPTVAIAWLLFLAALGARSHLAMASDLRDRICEGLHLTGWGWAMLLLFAFFAIVALVGVYTPPTLLEWDSLSYHLADPKFYLQAHRIYYLPWESHSNFAFTTEMWYLYGLMLNGVPLAKWFHFGCAVGACLAVYAFGARHLTPRIGLLAALLLASTPLVFWEAGTAYADLTATFFAILTLLAVFTGMRLREERWLWVGAILMGLTLSAKATSVTTLALLAAGLLVWRLARLRQPALAAIGLLAAWCLLALIVGSPWYIKSFAYTGNPIYPFYYHLFGGRNFNATLAAAYDQSNADFGYGANVQDAHSLFAAALLPWNLSMYLLPGHPTLTGGVRPFNDFQTPLQALSPLLLAALFFPAYLRTAPTVIKALGLFALASLLLWFVASQEVRYLLPLIPALCLLTAWVLDRALSLRSLSGYALAGLGVCSLAFSIYVGVILVSLEAPVVFGQESRGDYIARNFAAYPAMQYVNTQLPPDAKIVFYGNPLGYYCDRSYFWGDNEHSTVIPYDQFHSAVDLRNYLARIHVTHILVNLHYFPLTPGNGYPGWIYDLTIGSGPPVFEKHNVAVWALPPAK